MQSAFDVIVIGKGMMGVAAARHLALAGARVALIGPDEPRDWAAHPGVFASHYDNGRITRTIDPSADWARLARRSIERYGEIESRSGIRFYTEAGCLILAREQDDGLAAAKRAADALDVATEHLSPYALAERFPALAFSAGDAGLYEASGAGHINPRAFVAASLVCAVLLGVTVLSKEVRAVEDTSHGVTVEMIDGTTLLGGKALVATGAFALQPRLTGVPLDLSVFGRTVVFAEIGPDDAARLAAMPSLIRDAAHEADSYYVLPPIVYPDGRTYLKIGGDPTDRALADEGAIRAWFRSGGDDAAAAHMARHLSALLPDLRPVSLHHAPCAVTKTVHDLPYIGFPTSPRIAVLIGGNGKAAKSADEIGRLGAVMVEKGTLAGEGYSGDFSPVVR